MSGGGDRARRGQVEKPGRDSQGVSRRGRKRDSEIDRRIRHAARVLYATDGWIGFHLVGVAKASGVSRDAVNRRYADSATLLLDALADQTLPALSETAPVQEALVAYAVATFDYVASGDGFANLRVHLDGECHPEILWAYHERVVAPAAKRDIETLQRARDAGLLGTTTDCEAVIMTVNGTMLAIALARQAGAVSQDRQSTIRHIQQVVHQILHGAVGPRTDPSQLHDPD
ncbi:TetR/AcrR family transcriptional regulator [[Mycobacterium] vasticus]|uniref:HTH tetR-type domain-containing protein n=1 Tax=[Mycobacterium] vasticus TaxID=2875777 RepID=A0ABU5Z179_9MYCO|nr:hypothetical protein [Mycolicibacter sp. MYC017]MEB3071152.1 hypothetical protein [Mycolicibacter sp. MYC017]